MNNRVSNHMFKMLEKEGIKTHFVEEISDRETVVQACGDCAGRSDCEEYCGRQSFEASRYSGGPQAAKRQCWNTPIRAMSWAIR